MKIYTEEGYTKMHRSFKNYESNYIQIYDNNLSTLEKILGTSEYIFLDHKGTSNKFYGMNKCEKYGVKLKVLSEEVYSKAPDYKFFKVKIPIKYKKSFISAMNRLKLHMFKIDDDKYFTILNKFLIHQWVEGFFSDDPNNDNIDRINRSLKASRLTTVDNILTL